jgi:hypothetical protein
VLETNSPPVLAPIADKTVSEGQLLTFTAEAFDPDLPPQQLTFSLGPGAPSGATIHPETGVFTWTPTSFQGGVTYQITVIVTDDGDPPMNASRTFSVVVFDTSPDFELSIGTTELLSGDSASLALSLHSGADLTNIHAVIEVTEERLTNLALHSLAPGVASAEVQSLGSNQFELRFVSQSGAAMQGEFVLAQLAFDTVPHEHSAVVNLSSASMTGQRASGLPLDAGRVNPGRVFVIGVEPILDVAGGNSTEVWLNMYSRPGFTYFVERRFALHPTNDWTEVATVVPGELKTDLAPISRSGPVEFFRAGYAPLGNESLALPGLRLTSHLAADGNIVLLISGLPGVTYTVEFAEQLAPANWQKLTNVAVLSEGVGTVEDPGSRGFQRFYRVVRPAY